MLTVQPHPRSSCGFGLVECLVALTVLAVGILASLAALLAGLRTSRTATQWTVASMLAADLADCIRGNAKAGPAYSLEPGTAPPVPAKDCRHPGECSASDVAALDLSRWHVALTAALPEASAAIAVRAAGAPAATEYTIVIRWRPVGQLVPAEIALTVQS